MAIDMRTISTTTVPHRGGSCHLLAISHEEIGTRMALTASKTRVSPKKVRGDFLSIKLNEEV
jgi:hypothetical protein